MFSLCVNALPVFCLQVAVLIFEKYLTVADFVHLQVMQICI